MRNSFYLFIINRIYITKGINIKEVVNSKVLFLIKRNIIDEISIERENP